MQFVELSGKVLINIDKIYRVDVLDDTTVRVCYVGGHIEIYRGDQAEDILKIVKERGKDERTPV